MFPTFTIRSFSSSPLSAETASSDVNLYITVEPRFLLDRTITMTRISPRSIFITEPAMIIIILCHAGLLLNESGSETSSSSPFIETYPPIGRRRSEYAVPDFLEIFDIILGPMPIENSLIPTPNILAVIKCPHS